MAYNFASCLLISKIWYGLKFEAPLVNKKERGQRRRQKILVLKKKVEEKMPAMRAVE